MWDQHTSVSGSQFVRQGFIVHIFATCRLISGVHIPVVVPIITSKSMVPSVPNSSYGCVGITQPSMA